MKFKADQHIVGKVYDLTQENMQNMLLEIDRLRDALNSLHWQLIEAWETTEGDKDANTR